MAFVVSILSLPMMVWAQECTPRSVGLWSQADIDNFQAEHGPCDHLSSLYIHGEDITNLDGLSDIVRLNWSLQIIDNPALTDVNGLSSLNRVGTLLLIQRNDALPNLDGLTALTSVGEGLGILSNDRLENIDGLSSLVNVGGSILIDNNALLENLDGLSSLVEVATDEQLPGLLGFGIRRNPSLSNVDGLAALERIGNIGSGGFLGIADNASLRRVTSLTALETIWGFLTIAENPRLETVSGLDSLTYLPEGLGIYQNPLLTTLQGPPALQRTGELGLEDNAALASVQGFESLTYIHSHLEIVGNELLTDVSALAGLVEVSGNLEVRSNPSLGSCQAFSRLVDEVDDADPGPGAGAVPDVGIDVILEHNLPGCNSITEILASPPLMQINAGLNDAWFNLATPGQGFFFSVFPDIGSFFLAWFTFDVERPGESVATILGEPGHRWLTAFGTWEDDTVTLTIELTSGGVFDSPEPPMDPQVEYGTITIVFHNCNHATLSYDIPSHGLTGTIELTRIALDNTALCEALNAS